MANRSQQRPQSFRIERLPQYAIASNDGYVKELSDNLLEVTVDRLFPPPLEVQPKKYFSLEGFPDEDNLWYKRYVTIGYSTISIRILTMMLKSDR